MSEATIYVDASQVDAMIHRCILAVAGPSLMKYLAGAAAQMFSQDIESRFEEEGDPKSGWWEPLSPATERIRESEGYTANDINVRTGSLKEFLTSVSNYGYAFGADWASLDVPGNVPTSGGMQKKLQTAQEGSPDNPLPGFGPTPPRPVLAWSQDADVLKLLRLLEAHIVTQMGGRV